MKHYVKKGYFIGITGYVCKKNRATELRKALAQNLLPLTQLMIETDGPYMCPVKVKRCEPAMLSIISRELATLMNVDWLQLCEQTTANVRTWSGLE
jgi:TatD DNase family protein